MVRVRSENQSRKGYKKNFKGTEKGLDCLLSFVI
jgi:hypothetical protein